uniref:Uracil-DNA glycosylase-like domain-containing protein n=1 Tax=Aegilops tauschii subsp. strangulata TaxID=200361 RepID=A0A453DE92_AEGTS
PKNPAVARPFPPPSRLATRAHFLPSNQPRPKPQSKPVPRNPRPPWRRRRPPPPRPSPTSSSAPPSASAPAQPPPPSSPPPPPSPPPPAPRTPPRSRRSSAAGPTPTSRSPARAATSASPSPKVPSFSAPPAPRTLARVLTELLGVSHHLAAGGGAKLEELLVEETWLEALSGELRKPYALDLCRFVAHERLHAKVPVYPPPHLVFHALHTTPFHSVKAVIIGQDPYHGPGQAMGLSFSVPEGIKIPSSLQNIFKELHKDLGCTIPSHGNLERWAVQVKWLDKTLE